MKAVVYTTYGLPDVLKLEEIEKHVLRDDEILIKIHAVSINGSDRVGRAKGKVVITLENNDRNDINFPCIHS